MAERDSAGIFDADASQDVKLKSFAPDELLTCDGCLRANPPTRAACLYCGAPLTSQATLVVQETATEPHTAAVSTMCYVVLPPKALSEVDEHLLDEIAKTIEVKSSDLRTALISHSPLLLAGMNDKASKTINDLRQMGIDSLLVADADLKLSVASRTIHALEFTDEGLAGSSVSSAARLPARWDELMLVVIGRLQTHRSEIEERRRRGGLKPIARREVAEDESVLDLYVSSSDAGWRISASNFDFSCLGDRKTLTAFDNFRGLINLLSERTALKVNESYFRMRPLLVDVWPLQKQTRKGAWRRSGAGKYDVSTVTTTDNETQFNNYSRLLWFLKKRETECQKPDS